MPVTYQSLFQSHTVRVEVKIARLIPGTRQREDAWQYVDTLTCTVIPGSANRGARFGAAAEAIFYHLYFESEPPLTTAHRLWFNGLMLNFLGKFQPGGVDSFWLVYASSNSQEQPQNFMTMDAIGVSGEAALT